MACSWGIYAMGCLAFIIFGFYLIPLSTVQLTDYLQNIVDIIIVMLGFLISYQIIVVEDSDIQKFTRTLRKKYNGEVENNDDVEAAGAIAAALTNKVMSLENNTNS